MAAANKEKTPSDWVPPDGGYGWVIVFASFLLWILFTGYSQVGIFMLEFAPHLGVSLTVFGWLNAAQTVPGRFLAIFIGTQIKRIGCRKVVLVGTFLMSGGYLASAFVSSVPLMYLTYGLLPSLRAACFFCCAAVAPQQYFDKKRSLATGFALVGLSAGYFSWPPIGTNLIAKLGYKYTLIIEASIIFGVGMLSLILLRPPGISKRNVTETSTDENVKEEPKCGEKCCSLHDIVDYRPMKNPVMAVFWVGVLFGTVGQMTTVIYTPTRSQIVGIDKESAAFHTSTLAISGGVASFVFAIIGNLSYTNRAVVYLVGHIGAGIATLLSTLFDSSPFFFGYAAIVGIFHGMFIGVEMPLLVDINGIDLLPAASGWFAAVFGLAHLITHPVTGWLLDATENPNSPFYLCGASQTFAGLMLIYVPWGLWNRNKYLNSHDKGSPDEEYDIVTVTHL